MKIKVRRIISLALILSLLIPVGFPIRIANAASLLNKSDTMSTMKSDTASNHTIVFRTPTGANENTDTITVDFDNDFVTTGIAVGDIDLEHSAGGQSNCSGVTYSNSETLAASASATEWGVAINTTTDVVTFTAPTDGVGAAAIATNACVKIEIGTNASGGSGQIINATSSECTGSSSSCTIAVGGAFGDSGDIVVNMLGDDQVSVSATVDESLNFSISDTTIGFGTLSASAARYATGDTNGSATETGAHNLVAGTNATNGYTITVTGNTLTSGGNTITAIGDTNTVSSTGNEQFGLRMSASGGSGTVTAPYADSGFALDTAAFPDQVASYTGPSSDTTYSVRYLANIASNTEAGAYTSTLTFIATANY